MITESLDHLKLGQSAIIKSFTNTSLSSRLIDMGCLPGERVSLSKIAPFGCPMAINVAGYELSLRRDEAAFICIELLS